MRLEVLDAKKRFEQRIEEFKKQLDDYRKSNDIIDELKKAHARELATHIQEHNRKFNELLKAKLDSEDALKAQFEADKAALNKDWERKLKEAVAQATEKTRKEEQDRARAEMEKVRATHESQIEILEMKVKRLEGDLAEALKRIKEKDQTIAEKEVTISQRDTRIKELEKEI